jgi:hypothetical protein
VGVERRGNGAKRSDLAEQNPGGGAKSPPERIPFVMCCLSVSAILFF